MNGIGGLYGFDIVPVMFGEGARRASMYMYAQDAGEGCVSFIGASRMKSTGLPNPLRYGSERTHQLVIGDVIVIPKAVIGTDALRGSGLSSLIQDVPSGPQLIHDGMGEIAYLAPGYHDDLMKRSPR